MCRDRIHTEAVIVGADAIGTDRVSRYLRKGHVPRAVIQQWCYQAGVVSLPTLKDRRGCLVQWVPLVHLHRLVRGPAAPSELSALAPTFHVSSKIGTQKYEVLPPTDLLLGLDGTIHT